MTNNKQQTAVKLYTEEDLIKAIAFGFGVCRKEDRAPFNTEMREFINSLTPIEIPTDEEIEQESNNEYQEQKQSYENSVEMFPIDFANYLKVGFIDGAKWMRDKIRMQGR